MLQPLMKRDSQDKKTEPNQEWKHWEDLSSHPLKRSSNWHTALHTAQNHEDIDQIHLPAYGPAAIVH